MHSNNNFGSVYNSIFNTFLFVTYIFPLSAPNQTAGGDVGIYVHTYILNISSTSPPPNMVIYFNHPRI